MDVNKLQARIFQWRKQAGHETAKDLDFQFRHLVEEVGEVAKAIREGDLEIRIDEDGKPQGAAIELADVIFVALETLALLGYEANEPAKVKLNYLVKKSVRVS